MTVFAVLFARLLASVFVSGDLELLEMTTRGMRINAISFLVVGINIFTSAFFTALGNGAISLLISFSRLFLAQVIALFVMSALFGLDGVWSAVIVAEAVSLVLSVAMLMWKRKSYHYA